jgi:Mg-chelatase subunit ChlD
MIPDHNSNALTVATVTGPLVRGAMRPDAEHIVLLLDASGSMSASMPDGGSRTAAVIKAVGTMLNLSLPKRSCYTLLTFGQWQNYLLPERGPSNDFALCRQAVAKLGSWDGATNIAPGIAEALSAKPHRVVLLTDGEATDNEDSIMAQAAAAASAGVKIDTVAIGEAAYSQRAHALLKAIAERTGGTFSTAADASKLANVYKQLETSAYRMLEHRNS